LINYKTSILFKIINYQGVHKKKKTLPDGTMIRYETPTVTSVPVRLESNDTLIFRQCVPHQGMVYESNNVLLQNMEFDVKTGKMFGKIR